MRSFRFVKVIAFLLGLFLLLWIIRKLGVQELLTGFRTLSWRLVIPVLIILPCYFLYTSSWTLFLRRFDKHFVPYWQLFRIKIAGEATNTLTPLNFAGGDPIRVWLLKRHFPVEIAGASVVVDRTLQIMAIVSLILLGNVAAVFKLDLPGYAKAFLGGTAGFAFFFFVVFIFFQTKGLFQSVTRVLAKLRIRRFSEKTLEKLKDLDHHIGDFYRRARGLFFFCYLLHFLARLIGIAELYVLGQFLGVPMGWWEALFFSAVIPMTNMVGAIVPGNLGVLEGVVSTLFYALHWNPADGVIIQIARRIRSFVWILIGLLFLMIFKKEKSDLRME